MSSTATLEARPLGIDGVLESVDARPTAAAYAKAARELNSCTTDLSPLRVSLLGSVTLDSLVPYLQVEAARAGFRADVYVGPFNSIQQELLDPRSGCQDHEPDLVIVAARLEELAPDLVAGSAERPLDEFRMRGDTVLAELSAMVETFRTHSSAALQIHNFMLPMQLREGLHDAASSASQSQLIRRLNADLRDVLTGIPDVSVVDVDGLCSQLGYAQCYEPKMWYLARAPFSAQGLREFARLHIRHASARRVPRKKCLVVDLDNTLWGGVIGEDGLAGIQLGQTYPGNAFADVQRALLHLAHQGILLAINSKNHAEDVWDVFRSHPDMVLRREDFAACRINWQPKPNNMQELAEELNLGLDSFVFLDDNPTECEWMRTELPDVLTWSACDSVGRPDPLAVLQRLHTTHVFDRLRLTQEDRQRSELYRQQTARRVAASHVSSLDDFLVSLEQHVEIEPVSDFTLPRVAELLQKTNQFNLTTRRHTAARIQEFMSHPSNLVVSMRVVDKFGDNGIVGAAIVESAGETATIETLLLSCRVIGRKVESALLSHVADWARHRAARSLVGEFIPTAKNGPAADFLPGHKFMRLDDGADGRHVWQFDLSAATVPWPTQLQRVNLEART